MEKRKIEVYIDGSSVDVNARDKGKEAEWHGAYAGVFYVDGQEVMRMKGYEKGGTIGKMELMALVQAMIKCLGYSEATIYSDSQYVVNGATKWLKGWKKKNFKDIKFPAMWVQVDMNLHGACNFGIRWVKGHHECPGNHVADKLANKALGAGITGWKVSGKERFLLFDKVEGFMKSSNTGDMLPIHYIHEEAGPFPVITEQMRKDADEFVKFGEKGFTTKQQIEEYKKAEPLFREQEKKLWFSDDNDFTDMAKKKHSNFLKETNINIPAHRTGIVTEFTKSEKVYPTWYEQQIAKHKELIKKQTEEFNQMMDRYAKHVEEIIYELKIEKEKQDGTRSTKSNP